MSALDDYIKFAPYSYNWSQMTLTEQTELREKAQEELKATQSRIAELEAMTQWHEVGLIHDGTDLVITYNGREVDVGWYHPDSKDWHLINGQPVRSKITHWMPLPKPPKEGEK